MSIPLINKEKFIGKTIKSINVDTCNWIKLYFTDGSEVELEVEYLGHDIYGIVQQGSFE